MPASSTDLQEAERALLAGCIIDKDIYYRAIGTIGPDDFASDINRLIFNDLVELRTSTGQADYATLSEYMQGKKDLDRVGGKDYLLDLSTSYQPSVEEIDNYINLVRDKSLARRFFSLCDHIKEEYNSKPIKDVSSFIGEAEKKIIAVTTERRTSNFRDPKSVITSLRKSMEAEQQFRKENNIKTPYLSGYSTGFSDVDKLTGGFHPGDLIILAARPSVGKTALALNFAQKIAGSGKYSVGFFSLEMKAELLMRRLLSMESRLTQTQINELNMQDESYMSPGKEKELYALSSAIERLSREQLYIVDSSKLTINDITTQARQLKERHSNLALIVVDYLGYITPVNTSSQTTREQEVANITKGLKQLARDLNVPVLCLSQLRRPPNSKTKPPRPSMSELRESGEIEQTADMVFLIHRDDYFQKEGEDGQKGQYNGASSSITYNEMSPTTLILDKNRNGKTGEINFNYYKQYSRFELVADPNEYGSEE
ncbi:MAG: replicative DNA helicase [Firmicutes bacterium]|uniref:Replicative DNA helicase n=1 Tax=Candidatus Scatoplasma merdavium TaxID=2840932 RepID=A0A9D9GR99_9BACL|nr:replicative DNA helicase [Candidatus Scatoplasma merdavium]